MHSARCVGRRVLRCLLAFGSPPVLERTDGQSAFSVPRSADAGNLQQTMEDVKIKTGFGGACAFLSPFALSRPQSKPNRLTEMLGSSMHSDVGLALADRHADRVGVCRLPESANGQSAVSSLRFDLPRAPIDEALSRTRSCLIGGRF